MQPLGQIFHCFLLFSILYTLIRPYLKKGDLYQPLTLEGGGGGGGGGGGSLSFALGRGGRGGGFGGRGGEASFLELEGGLGGGFLCS